MSEVNKEPTKIAKGNQQRSVEDGIDADTKKSFHPVQSHPFPVFFCISFAIIPFLGVVSNVGVFQTINDFVQ